MSRSGAEMHASENTSKFIQQRISNVEKHFGDLCQGLGNYLRRLSKARDAGDDLSKFLMTYADKETFNSSTKESLQEFAAHIAAVQDYKDSEIQRLDNKVLGPLTEYGTECKHAKEYFENRKLLLTSVPYAPHPQVRSRRRSSVSEHAHRIQEKLKQAFAARNKEIKEAKNLNKAKANPRNQQGLSQAETDLQKASVDATRASKQLETEMDAFERRKLDDIKRIFLDFVNIEMLFHARALEMYTQSYQSISRMSEDVDLEEFRSSLRPPSSQGRMDPSGPYGSRTSLNTTGVSSGAPPSVGRSTPSTTPAAARRPPIPTDTPTDTLNTTNRTSMYSETQDEDYDEDEDEYEEDEDEEEESENDTYAQRFRRK